MAPEQEPQQTPWDQSCHHPAQGSVGYRKWVPVKSPLQGETRHVAWRLEGSVQAAAYNSNCPPGHQSCRQLGKAGRQCWNSPSLAAVSGSSSSSPANNGLGLGHLAYACLNRPTFCYSPFGPVSAGRRGGSRRQKKIRVRFGR